MVPRVLCCQILGKMTPFDESLDSLIADRRFELVHYIKVPVLHIHVFINKFQILTSCASRQFNA